MINDLNAEDTLVTEVVKFYTGRLPRAGDRRCE